MAATLIVNPVAGTDAAPEYLPLFQRRLSERFGSLSVALTRKPGDARQAARESAEAGHDHLIVAGGDGTLNEALNGLALVDGAFDRTTIGIVPLGTGNDFARAVGLPDDPTAALDLLLAGHVRRFDLGRVNDRVFINVSAGGFIAEVSEAVDPTLKSVAGRLAYLIGGARVLLAAEPFVCNVNGRRQSCLMFAVCNAPMIGGGRLIAPHATPDDGALDVCAVSDMGLVEFVALLRRVADGSHVTDERVTYFAAREVALEFDRPVAVNADGEVFEARSCRYHILPGIVRLLAP